MKRRAFISFLGGAIAPPLSARAQQKAMPVIGFLNGTSPGPFAPYLATFRQGLSETGYTEGQNVAIEYRWAEGHYDWLPELAADLVGRKVDVIAATGGTPPAQAAKSATSAIPIVFASGNPVGDGLVTNLARPDGNLTGVSFLLVELHPKRLELLSELVPQARVIALLVNPNNPTAERIMRDVQSGAHEGGTASYPERQHRTRDRRRLHFLRPTARRRGPYRRRPVLRQPARTVGSAGSAPCHSRDLFLARVR